MLFQWPRGKVCSVCRRGESSPAILSPRSPWKQIVSIAAMATRNFPRRAHWGGCDSETGGNHNSCSVLCTHVHQYLDPVRIISNQFCPQQTWKCSIRLNCSKEILQKYTCIPHTSKFCKSLTMTESKEILDLPGGLPASPS